MEIGIMQSGIQVVQSLDLDRSATDCMEANPHYFGHNVLNTDIKNVTVLDQPQTDIVVGTYPCTKYSTIADIHGTRSGDDLYLHFFRHLVLERPEMFIVENVPGMKKFPVVMEAITQIPEYYVTVICPLDASLWLPQKRKRLIVIGTRKPFSISAPREVRRRSLSSIMQYGAHVNIPEYVHNRIAGKYRDKPIIVNPDDPGALAPTCVAHYSKDLGTRLVNDRGHIRPFTIREWARLQGFPDDFRFPDSPVAYKLIGNAVPVDMGRWIGEQALRYFN